METLKRFWFEPRSPLDLGVHRALFIGFLFLSYLPYDFSAWGEIPDLLWNPVPSFELLGLKPTTPAALFFLGSLWKVCLLLAALGLWTRPALLLSVPLGFYLLGLAHCYGKVRHHDAVVVVALFVLAFSRCGDGFSLDANRQKLEPTASGAYTWPLRTLQAHYCSIFFRAGINKLYVGGWMWGDGASLSALFLEYHYRPSENPSTDLGLWIAESPSLCGLLGKSILILELATPLALFSRRARCFLIPCCVLLLVGFRLILMPAFYPVLMASVVWIPWSALLNHLAKSGAPEKQGDTRHLAD